MHGNRKRVVTTLILALAVVVSAACNSGPPVGEGHTVNVYLTPTCACCKLWVAHMRSNGFEVITEEIDQDQLTQMKRDNGVTVPLRACHTSKIEGYTVEGHVPADLVAKMLAEQSDIAGIAVAGMPPGAPGMESRSPHRYRVMAFHKDGRTEVYAER